MAVMIKPVKILAMLCAAASVSVAAAMPAPAQIASGGGDAGKTPFTAETHDVPPIEIDPAILSIAERYRHTTQWGGVVPALEKQITCEIGDDGAIDRRTCQPDSWSDREQSLAIQLLRAMAPSALPVFPAIDRAALGLPPRAVSPFWSTAINFSAHAPEGNKPPFFRLARLTVRTREMPRPSIDLTTGVLVDVRQIVLQAGTALRGDNYPARARREARAGAQLFECQVQTDRSVICQDISFDPPENAPYFTGMADRLYMRAIVKEQLENGDNAIGVRFRPKIRWALPD
ncbi:hypothetical protein [Sphingomonas alpina]|uniref:TonB C-terminal domain-containing protein n=1 Tax=Sphingomonas alpina TaxID=653931 RepID=A0A7H0LNY4_9SPHN|nr:hypothetical protein [Sphingomonas alpina]QNQ11387.1 hypothetical protein H3Z74_09725 [Sphingomonas alpina]